MPSEEKERNHFCKICNTIFTEKVNLPRHLKNKHDIDQSSIDQQQKLEEWKRKDEVLNQQKVEAKKHKVEERKSKNDELNQQKEERKKHKVEELMYLCLKMITTKFFQ